MATEFLFSLLLLSIFVDSDLNLVEFVIFEKKTWSTSGHWMWEKF